MRSGESTMIVMLGNMKPSGSWVSDQKMLDYRQRGQSQRPASNFHFEHLSIITLLKERGGLSLSGSEAGFVGCNEFGPRV